VFMKREENVLEKFDKLKSCRN